MTTADMIDIRTRKCVGLRARASVTRTEEAQGGEGRLPEVPNVQVTSVAEGSADELGAEQNKQGIGPSEPTTVAVWPVQAQSFWRPGEIDSIFSRELLPGDCLKSWVGKER